MKTVILIIGLCISFQTVNSQTVVVDTVIQSQAFGFLQDGVGINKTIYGHFDDNVLIPIILLNKSSKNILYVVDESHTYIFFKDKPFRIKKEHQSKIDLKDDFLREYNEVMVSYISDECISVVDEEYKKMLISSGYITLSYKQDSGRNKVIIVFKNVILTQK